MTRASDSEETTVLATYVTRRDAEMARDHLEEAGLQTFVRADDGGGLYPQLQRPHGVQLVGMSGSAHRARYLLAEADLLPEDEPDAEEAPAPESASDGDDLGRAVYGLVLVLGAIAAVLVLLMVVLG
jgi:hypothetical protein